MSKKIRLAIEVTKEHTLYASIYMVLEQVELLLEMGISIVIAYKG